MTVRINKQKINLREKLTEFEDKVNFDEVVRGLGKYTGNVGIGTAGPQNVLHVEGSAANKAIAYLKNTDSADGNGFIIRAGGSNSQKYIADFGNAAATSVMKVMANGNVGISTANPGYRLEVVENRETYAAQVKNAGTNPFGLLVRYTDGVDQANSNPFIVCTDEVAARMRVYSDGDVWTSDSGTLTSDEQLKTNIVDATPKLEDIKKLKVRNFEWIPEFHPAKVGEKKIGFIAQELEQVFPGLVDEHDMNLGEEEISRKSVRLGALIPILVKGMQEQQQLIDDLKSRIETLEQQ